MITFTCVAIAWTLRPRTDLAMSRALDALAFYESMPARQWTQVASTQVAGWHRQAHAGAAYDSRRGTVLVFGSDTHGTDWDNVVHEFNPVLRSWRPLGSPSAADSYTLDARGQPVAGPGAASPWAMHTYDGLAYDPRADALVVAASIDHTPVKVPGTRVQRPWSFDRAEGRWRVLATAGEFSRSMFSASLVYDGNRDTLVFCQNDALWELGPDRARWRRIGVPAQCDIHHVAEFDARTGRVLYFGGYRPSAAIRAYSPAATSLEPGTWQPLAAQDCPHMSASPVAYDRRAERFVILASPGDARPARTFLYDAAAGRCEALPIDTPEIGKLNFMLVWHADLELSLLITGSPHAALNVWALKL
ncbi:MAG: hypothetical protein AB7O21_18325 [Gammaproteobacteria bacterium]